MMRIGFGGIGNLEESSREPADKYLKNATVNALHEGEAASTSSGLKCD